MAGSIGTMQPTINLLANPVIAKIETNDSELKSEISQLLSYEVAGAEHTGAYQGGTWSGRSSLFNYSNGTFPSGLISIVYSRLKQKGYQIRLIRKPAPEPLGILRPQVNEFGYSEEYAYQYETVDLLVKHRAIIAQVATGGGKSNIANIAVARIKRPTLFLTTRSVLMHQMKRAFEYSLKYRAANGEPELKGVEVGVMGDGVFAPRKNINVGMVQTIQAKLKSENPTVVAKMKQILEMFELVILEEAHESSGEGYYQILNACKNAHYRLALTATPFMRDDEEANMRLMAVSGPIAIQVTEKELIEKGILARPIFKYVTPPQDSRVRPNSNWQRAYQYGIIENEARNRAICAETRRFASWGLSAMILVQRKEHGNRLEAALTAAGLRARFIWGESDQAQRDAALKELAAGKLDALIGSTILDVGVDVPAVGAVILAGGGKAEVALRQRIGRGLRRKPKGMENIAFVIDFMDVKNKYLTEHSIQRRMIVESTPGFVENILGQNGDFERPKST